MRRIELLTPCLQGRCSPSWATPPFRLLLRANPFHYFVKTPRHTLSIVFVVLPHTEKATLSDWPLRSSAFGGLRAIPFHYLVKTPRHTLSIVFVVLPHTEKAALSEWPLQSSALGGLRAIPFGFMPDRLIFRRLCLCRNRRVLCAHKVSKRHEMRKIGGPKWTRTTDLTLIRRAL